VLAVVALETGCVVERSMGVGRKTLEMGCGEVDTMDLGWRATLLEIGLTDDLAVMALETGCVPVSVVIVYVVGRICAELGMETEGYGDD